MRGVDTKMSATDRAALGPAVHQRLQNAALAEVSGSSGGVGGTGSAAWAVHADGEREWHGWRAAAALAVLAKLNLNPAGLHVNVYELLWEVRL
jgi:hypothetical protein